MTIPLWTNRDSLRQEMIDRFRASELKPCYSSRKLLEILGNFLNPKPVEIHKQRDELCFKTGVLL